MQLQIVTAIDNTGGPDGCSAPPPLIYIPTCWGRRPHDWMDDDYDGGMARNGWR